MAKLYEIDNAILECIDMETGEVIDFERLEALQIAREKKIENAAKWHINLLSDAEHYKKQKEKFAALEKAAKQNAEGLKVFLVNALNGAGFSTIEVNISYRASEAVKIKDEKAFKEWAAKNHDEYLKYSEPDIDLTAIKKALKSGQEIEGAYIEKRSNIQIK